MEKALISRCLLEERCRYDGLRIDPAATPFPDGYEWISLCQETDVGLPVPRSMAEISAGGGHDVLECKLRIFDNSERDLTDIFITGAHLALETARNRNIKIAFLKDKSPSCGENRI